MGHVPLSDLKYHINPEQRDGPWLLDEKGRAVHGKYEEVMRIAAETIIGLYIPHSLTHSLTYGTEPLLRSCQLCSHSRTSQHFMEPEGSLPYSQEPSTGPYPESDQSNLYHPILSL
jgi:hypothetical protein